MTPIKLGGKRAKLNSEERARLEEPWAQLIVATVPAPNNKEACGVRQLCNLGAHIDYPEDRVRFANVVVGLATDTPPMSACSIYRLLREGVNMIVWSKQRIAQITEDHSDRYLFLRHPDRLDEPPIPGVTLEAVSDLQTHRGLHTDIHACYAAFFDENQATRVIGRPSYRGYRIPPLTAVPSFTRFWKMWNNGDWTDRIILIGLLMQMSPEEIGAWHLDHTKFTARGMALIFIPKPGSEDRGRTVFPIFPWMNAVLSRYKLRLYTNGAQTHMVGERAGWQITNRLKTLRQKSGGGLSVYDIQLLGAFVVLAEGRVSEQVVRHLRGLADMAQVHRVIALLAEEKKAGRSTKIVVDPKRPPLDVIGCPACGSMMNKNNAPRCQDCQLNFEVTQLELADYEVARIQYRRAVLCHIRDLKDQKRAQEALEIYLQEERKGTLAPEWRPSQ